MKNKILISLALFVLLFAPVLEVAKAQSSPKIYVQWAQSSPNDWTLVSTSTWSNQPTNSDPTGDVNLLGVVMGDSLLNNSKGYVFALNVQGVVFAWYDHYAIEGSDTSVTVTAWRDDPILFPTGTRQADVAVINSLKFDSKVGQDNTDQIFTWYREGIQYNNLLNSSLPSNVTLKNYSEFVVPDSSVIKPGIYVSDSKWNEHIAAETQKGWR